MGFGSMLRHICMVLHCSLLGKTTSFSSSARRSIRSSSLSLRMSSDNGQPRRLSIGVIGGGAAGLATARAFLRSNGESNTIFDVTVFESRMNPGGVWKYDEEASGEKKSRPMYRNLRTNLPKELMQFPEFAWGEGDGRDASYVTHSQVQEYLENYTNEFNLHAHIKYGCKVEHLLVTSDKGGESGDWPRVQLKWTEEGGTERVGIFDSVCVANGHYSSPSCPEIPGIRRFKGRIMHSIEYDDPNDFAGQTVLLIGARASGVDIAREIASGAKRVYLSDSTCTEKKEYGKVHHLPRTKSIDEDGTIHFSFGEKEWTTTDVDTICFASGYDYSFPFIDDDSNLDMSFVKGERRVKPLYKQLWHAKCPSLAFVGLPHSVVPFPLFDYQASAIVSQLCPRERTIPLPPLEDRILSAEIDARSADRIVDTHYLGGKQWDYCRDMCRIAGTYTEVTENYIATNAALYDRSGVERKGMKPGEEDLYRETRFAREDEKQTYRILHSELEPIATG